MSRIVGNENGSKEFAVIKFHADETYCTCSRKHKADDREGYVVGEQVTIKWSKNEFYEGIVVFTDGKYFKANFCYKLHINFHCDFHMASTFLLALLFHCSR